jgi:alpha-galactosidase
MRRKFITVLLGFALANLMLASSAAGPLPTEMAERDAWVSAKLKGVASPLKAPTGLVVIANHGAVEQNGRGGSPLKITDKTYSHGLYCHAVSDILVRLPGPGKTFSAVVGIDANGSYGGGSAVFSIHVGDKELAASPVMHRNEPSFAMSAELDGTTEFSLLVGDGGDNINSDQADWADATVTMADGTSLRVGDLPVCEYQRNPYSVEPPFSLNIGGASFADLIKDWRVERSEKELDSQRTELTQVYNDPKTGLSARCVGIVYKDFPTVEWTLHLSNNGGADAPIISNVKALDANFERNGASDFELRHWNGTYVNRSDYEPHISKILAGETKSFAPRGGRPCASEFPYFNLSMGNDGVIVAVGWPGQWSADFARVDDNKLHVTAGQELTHFKLHPGEEVRAPLIALQFWSGNAVRAQNVWRRWMWAHNIPRRNGATPAPQIPAVSGNQFPGLLCNEADEIRYIDRFAEEGVDITHWWMDAGWYINRGDWTSVGTWEIDKSRFPNGIKPIADHAHEKGMKLIVWFEPERVTPGSWLTENHPEWVLGGKGGGLLNLGDHDAWNWLVDCYDKIITEQKIDYYRQDFNMDPLKYWRDNDAEDRQGLTEIRHVEGYLAFWDELVRRHPDMMIDSCASGGHRNDLETLRRSVPLLRSDYIFDWTGEQCHSYGFASWVPYWGTGLIDFDAYSFRSCLGMDTTLSCDARRKDLDWPLLRKLVAQWKEAAQMFEGDYYPLTEYSAKDDVWMAWQFNRPEKGDGMIQAFRRPKCIYESAHLKLNDLEPATTYVVTDQDQDGTREISGKDLMDIGVDVSMPEAPQARVILYKRHQ